MGIKNISIEGNVLRVEMDEFEAKIIKNALPAVKPIFEIYFHVVVECIFNLVSMTEEERRELSDRLGRGEHVEEIIPELKGRLIEIVNQVNWPEDSDVRKILHWKEGEK